MSTGKDYAHGNINLCHVVQVSCKTDIQMNKINLSEHWKLLGKDLVRKW